MTGLNKIFVIDGAINVHFSMVGLNEDDAKKKALKLVNKIMNEELVGIVEWNFNLKQIREVQPMRYSVRRVNLNPNSKSQS